MFADILYTNGLHTLKCYDKKGNPKEIEVTPGTVVRFITRDGKHATYISTLTIGEITNDRGLTDSFLSLYNTVFGITSEGLHFK